MNQPRIQQTSDVVTAFIVKGYRSERLPAQPDAIFQIHVDHFHPRIGWELKDCITFGLPQEFRFLCLKDYEIRETSKGIFYCLYVRN